MGVGGDLSAAIDAYCLATVSDDALGDALIALRRGMDKLDLQFSRLVARHVETGAYERDGYLSPFQWLRNVCHMATMQAVDRVHVGLQLEQLPQSVEAVVAGEIGFTHLALIAETGLGEAALLPIAKEKDVTQFRHVCQHARHAADPDGYAEDSASEFEESFLELRLRSDGGAWLKGAVDREGAAALKSALGPLTRPSGEHDHRSQEQRQGPRPRRAGPPRSRLRLDPRPAPPPGHRLLRDPRRAPRLTGRRARVFATHLPGHRGAAGLRLQPHPRDPRLRLDGHRRRPQQADRQRLTTKGASRAGQGLPLARLRPPGE